jgi:hypothetical protein
MMNRLILLFAACAALSLGSAQTLPQFSSDSFEGWIYNNPGVELSTSNIGGGKIVLYTSANTGLTLTLISPEFSCQGIDTISSVVTWYTKGATASGFDLSRTALTLAIDDADGNPLDSMTVTPTTPGVSTHMLEFSIPVPQGLTAARLRFVSWRGVVASCGAIRSATFTAATSSPQTSRPGDVDGNGSVDISDVTALIDYLLGASLPIEATNADLDNDGVININDVTSLIDRLLSGY